MVRHFIITYFRSIRINKQYAIINYLGLSMAIAVILLIFLFVKNELTYDKFHQNHQHIYRLTTTLKTPSNEYNVAFANTAFVHKLREELAEIEFIACISKEGSYLVNYGDLNYREDLVRYSTPDIFKIFSYEIIKGNPERLLREPNTAVLTETLSGRLFSDADPIGEVVLFNDEVFTITGVMKDLPDNTDLKFSALLASPVNGSEHLMAWNDYFSYIRLNDRATSNFQYKIDLIAELVYRPFFTGDNEGLSRTYTLQPIANVHFDSSYLADTPKGNKYTVYIFLCIACLILIIACINLINLNLARAIIRQKELSIRQVNGAGKINLFVQLICESVMSAILSAMFSIIIARSLLPVFNKLADTHFEFNVFSEPSFLIAVLLIILFIGLITGLYPGVFQFRFIKSPGNTSVRINYGFSKLSKGLVTFQFVLSIVMVSVIIGIHKQMNHIQKFDLGFDQHQILSIDLNSVKNLPGDLQALKQELSSHFLVAAGGGGTQLGSSGEWRKPLYELKNERGEEVHFILNMPEIDENYLNLFGIELIEGRNFSNDFPSDYNESIIINRTYASLMEWNEPLGKRMFIDSGSEVIGVVSDFHFTSLHNSIEPLAFILNEKNPSYLFLKASPAQIKFINTLWQKHFKDVPIEFKYVDEILDNQYKKDKKQQSLFGYLSLIAIFISILGLYGISSFSIARRIKEIGIRKVNGARIVEVVALLNKDFIRWVVVAFFIAIPISWFAIHKWLQNFAYKTSLSWWIFILSGLIAIGIAFLTVSILSIRIAIKNPVEALRYE